MKASASSLPPAAGKTVGETAAPAGETGADGGGCGGGCVGGIVGGCFVPMLMLGLWLSGAFGPKFPSPIKKQETIDIKIEKGKVSEA